jgi:hypothetical protein
MTVFHTTSQAIHLADGALYIHGEETNNQQQCVILHHKKIAATPISPFGESNSSYVIFCAVRGGLFPLSACRLGNKQTLRDGASRENVVDGCLWTPSARSRLILEEEVVASHY